MSVEDDVSTPAEKDPYASASELQHHIPGFDQEKSEGALILHRHTFPRLEQPLWCPVDPDVVEFILIVDGTGHLERKLGGEWERGTFAPGDLLLHPGPAGPQAWCGAPHTHIRAYTSLNLLRRTASETSLGPDSPRVLPQFLVDAPLITTLLEEAWARLGTGRPTETLYARQVARALSLQTLKAYSVPKDSEVIHQAERSTDATWLQRVKDYVASHLGENICLEDLAEQAGMSEHHFAHQFRKAEGQPPYQYVIERRMERAKTLLTEATDSIAQVAFAVGYSSQSSFTAQFRKYAGTTPGQFRREEA